jgi:Sucrase/ferredoxin-like
VTTRPYCADEAREAGEALTATASRIDHWLLVEYRGRWDRDVLAGSLFSNELKAHLRGQLDRVARSRLLFVKQPERRSHARLMVYAGASVPGRERLHALEFERYDDLLGFDFAAALEDGTSVGHPLLVVCTHGKRDRCCARYGRPLYDALRREVDPAWVWQSTHVGGDRFAANLVVLPEGLYYGRVQPDGLAQLLAEHDAGRIALENYRGRSIYSFTVQAAERAVRDSTGLAGIGDLAFAGATRAGDGWTVRFRVETTGAVHEVDVVQRRADEARRLTCESPAPKRPVHCVAAAHRVLAG